MRVMSAKRPHDSDGKRCEDVMRRRDILREPQMSKLDNRKTLSEAIEWRYGEDASVVIRQ